MCMYINTTVVLLYTDPDLPPEDIELGRIAVEIAHIWQRVGLELGLPLHKLKTMENDNPGRSVMAALTMLSTWKDLDENVSRRTLYQAIDNCKAKGMFRMYQMLCFHINRII